jgi:hypothetical protein
MQGNTYSVQGYFEHAVLEGDFAVIQCILQDEKDWSAGVLACADTKPRVVEWIQVVNRLSPSYIRPEDQNQFLAVGSLGKKQCLAYQITRLDDNHVQITPAAYLPVSAKISIAVLLALCYLLPVLLSPIVWQKYAQRNLKLSRYYLHSFCHYLENRLVV